MPGLWWVLDICLLNECDGKSEVWFKKKARGFSHEFSSEPFGKNVGACCLPCDSASHGACRRFQHGQSSALQTLFVLG